VRKTPKLERNVLLIFSALLVSCSSCKGKFKWDPKPYVGNSIDSTIIREDGRSLACNEPAFDRIVCLDEEDVASLAVEIDRHSAKAGKVVRKEIRKIKKLRDSVK
jgi:hypothetical protein